MAKPDPALKAAPVLKINRPHAALQWLIRITGAVIACLSVVAFGIGLATAIVTAIHHPETNGWVTALMVIAPIVVFGMLFLIGYSMYLKVEQITVSYFIFIFALLVALVFFQFLPASPPESIVETLGGHNVSPDESFWVGIGYRATIALIVFFVFFAMLEQFLFRIMGYTTPTRRHKLAKPQTKTQAKAKVDPFDKTVPPEKGPVGGK